MLSTITAAETQFRHEYESRQRDIRLLASIRARRADESATARRGVAGRIGLGRVAGAPGSAAGWARPIGIPVSATAAATCAA